MNRPATLLAAAFLLATTLSASAPASASGAAPDLPPVDDLRDQAVAAANSTGLPVNGPLPGTGLAGPIGPIYPVSCGRSIVSQAGGSTRWTDPDGPGASGLNQDPVQLAATTPIPGAASLWKENPGVGEGSSTSDGVEFVAAFVVCPVGPNQAVYGDVQVLSDNANRVFVNNALVGSCGVWGASANCFGAPQGYLVPLLPYPEANTLRVHVMNAAGNNWNANPAQVAYRVDF